MSAEFPRMLYKGTVTIESGGIQRIANNWAEVEALLELGFRTHPDPSEATKERKAIDSAIAEDKAAAEARSKRVAAAFAASAEKTKGRGR